MLNQACKESLCLEQHVTNSVDIASLSVQFSNTESVNKAELWHKMLSHLPIKQNCFLFPYRVRKNVNKDHLCTICPLKKQIRNAFARSSIKTTCNSFQLLHIVIWNL